jgi:hypothetical protein
LKPVVPLSIRYWIDAQDRISAVNQDWLRFAAENGPGPSERRPIVGTSLWSFIADPTVGELYRQMVGAARLGRAVRFKYRCDAPSFRRLFEMRIQGAGDGAVEFASDLLDEEARPSVALLDVSQPRNSNFVRVCSWCQRIAVGEKWLPVEEGVRALGPMEHDTLPGLTHGICAECQATKMTGIHSLP